MAHAVSISSSSTSDDGWLVLQTGTFEGSRKPLVGPSAWKEVVPTGSRKDELFSMLRGCKFLQEEHREVTDFIVHSLRHCSEQVPLGWQPVPAAVLDNLPKDYSLSKKAVSVGNPGRISDFDSNHLFGDSRQISKCRRICYRLTEDGHGFQVRLEVNLPTAFGMLVHSIRFPTDGLSAEWRITDGRPSDIAVAIDCPSFKILDNSLDEAHPQPSRFLFNLRPEQQRSLQWMVYRETQSPPLVMEYRCYWHNSHGVEFVEAHVVPGWCLDCRISLSFAIRGGVLADQIGYGKTVVTIGLIDVRQNDPLSSIPHYDEGCFIPSRATLICVPPNLHQQWADEIVKFLGKQTLSVIRLSTASDMQKVSAKKLAEADVVLCNYQLLRGKSYEARRQTLLSLAYIETKVDMTEAYEFIFRDNLKSKEFTLDDLRKGTWDFLQCPHKHPWSRFLDCGEKEAGAERPAWERLRFPLLEQFYWRRVVFDEFHEAARLEATQQESLRFLRAHHRWGLSGTPSVGHACDVAKMASLLRVEVSLPSSYVYYENGGLLWENSSRFLDACVRQNTASIPRIQTVDHLVLVKHTPRERALYLAAAHVGDAEGGEPRNMIRNRRLMILCSHFSAESLQSENAEDECALVVENRQKGVMVAEHAFRDALHIREMFKCLDRPGIKADLDAGALARKFEEVQSSKEEHVKAVLDVVSRVQKEIQNQEPKQLAQGLDSKKKFERALKNSLIPLKTVAPPSDEELRQAANDCDNVVCQALERLLVAKGQLAFLQRTLSLVAEAADASVRSCSICYTEDLSLEQLGITPCAHVFCLDCLRIQIDTLGKCGICRHTLKTSDARPLMLEMEGQKAIENEAPAELVDTNVSSQALQRYGTKLGQIVTRLKAIKATDDTAKCIVFCQWECLLNKIAGAFRDFGIKYAKLRGSVHERARLISNFKDPASEICVLLLSLEDSASGTNLTCANHVLLVHPMNAESEEQSVAFELQAIGRVRRWGQLRPEIHVWRFCTVGTVEEEITRSHQKEVYERGPDALPPSAEQSELPGPSSSSSQHGELTKSGRGRASGRGRKRARGRQGAAQASASHEQCTEVSPWSCPRCTLDNGPCQSVCEACELPRPDTSKALKKSLRATKGKKMESSSSSTSSSSSSTSSSTSSSSQRDPKRKKTRVLLPHENVNAPMPKKKRMTTVASAAAFDSRDDTSQTALESPA